MRALLAAILIVVLGGAIAAGAYEAGLAQSAQQIVVPATVPLSGGAPVVAYYGHPYGWGFGFFPFGFLFPIVGLFLFFGLMRALIGGGRASWHHGWHDGQSGVPSRFDEWHKRSHGETTGVSDRPAPPPQ
ncbi:MAG TPA: hypothetical protein VGT60_05325 [Candidatus Limnocylindria bacterium]|nr:hypothetical protein [Candidatus Limnocylindria bacterium]